MMTPAQVDEVASKAAKQAVIETLKTLGFNVEDPAALRADMDHLRRWRLNVEMVGRQGVITLVTLVIGTVATAIGYGFAAMIKKTGVG